MRNSLEICLCACGAALLSVFNKIKMEILHEFWSGCHRLSKSEELNSFYFMIY